MNAQIYYDGSDVTNYVVEYTRQQQICTGIGVANIVLYLTAPVSPMTYKEFEIYEGGFKRGTYVVSDYTKSAPTGTISFGCQDYSKRLQDYFISETTLITEPTTARSIIEKYLNEADIEYSINTEDQGNLVNNQSVFGLTDALSIITQMLQMNGWYMYFNADNIAQIGPFGGGGRSGSDVDDSNLISFSTTKNDTMYRNRVVVYGMGSPVAGGWVHAEIDQHGSSENEYDDNDIRTVVISNAFIPDSATAYSLAKMAIDEFNKVSYEATIDVAGAVDIKLGDQVYMDTERINYVGTVTTIGSSLSAAGHITHAVLNQRCPRLFSYFNYGGYVYAGTESSGIWRKHLKWDHYWTSFNDGLTDNHIYDLKINSGIMACNAGKEAYVRNSGMTAWVKVTPSSFYDDVSQTTYTYSDVVAGGVNVNSSDFTIDIAFINKNMGVSWIVKTNSLGTIISTTQVKVLYYEDELNAITLDVDNFGTDRVITGTTPSNNILAQGNNLPSEGLVVKKVELDGYIPSIRNTKLGFNVNSIRNLTFYNNLYYFVSFSKPTTTTLRGDFYAWDGETGSSILCDHLVGTTEITVESSTLVPNLWSKNNNTITFHMKDMVDADNYNVYKIIVDLETFEISAPEYLYFNKWMGVDAHDPDRVIEKAEPHVMKSDGTIVGLEVFSSFYPEGFDNIFYADLGIVRFFDKDIFLAEIVDYNPNYRIRWFYNNDEEAGLNEILFGHHWLYSETKSIADESPFAGLYTFSVYNQVSDNLPVESFSQNLIQLPDERFVGTTGDGTKLIYVKNVPGGVGGDIRFITKILDVNTLEDVTDTIIDWTSQNVEIDGPDLTFDNNNGNWHESGLLFKVFLEEDMFPYDGRYFYSALVIRPTNFSYQNVPNGNYFLAKEGSGVFGITDYTTGPTVTEVDDGLPLITYPLPWTHYLVSGLVGSGGTLYSGEGGLYQGAYSDYRYSYTLASGGLTPFFIGAVLSGMPVVSGYVMDARGMRQISTSGNMHSRFPFTFSTISSGVYVVQDEGNLQFALDVLTTLSGYPQRLETTNYQDSPFVFVSTSGDRNRFFQKDGYMITEFIDSTYYDRTNNLPDSKVTIIRVDDLT